MAYNQTRESTLSASVTAVNAALEPLKVLKVLIEGLPANARTGLWLTNFKGVPVARTLSPFDLVYLDKENRVLHGVELSRDGEFAPFRGKPASALVLPPQSLKTSQTREGDQLELRPLAPEAQETDVAAPVASPPVKDASSTADKPVQEPAPELSPSAHFFSPIPAPAPAHVTEVREEPESPETQPAEPLPAEDASLPAPLETPSLSTPEPFAPDERRVEVSTDQDFFTPGLRNAPLTEEQPLITPEAAIEIREPVRRAASPEPVSSGPLIPISQPSVVRGTAAAEPREVSTASPAPELTGIEQAPAELPHYRDYAAPAAKQKLPWSVRLLRWLFPHLIIQEPERPPDRRRADRQALPGLIAYYFTGGTPEPQRIGNISVTGFYLHTDERWMPGTVVRMTLQRVGTKGDDPADTITVNSRIVRWGSDGEGFEFILTDLEE